jgi:hypothetical protein
MNRNGNIRPLHFDQCIQSLGALRTLDTLAFLYSFRREPPDTKTVTFTRASSQSSLYQPLHNVPEQLQAKIAQKQATGKIHHSEKGRGDEAMSPANQARQDKAPYQSAQ